MSRTALDYTRSDQPRRAFQGVDVTTPREGYYRCKLVSGGVRGGVRIWYGPPADPINGEILDRFWRWQAEFDGEYIELDRVWPGCAGGPITEQEYREYVGRKAWAQQNAPNSAHANRFRRHDPLSPDTPLPF